MPRRPAKVTQADIARAIRAAKEAGAHSVTIDSDGLIRIGFTENTKPGGLGVGLSICRSIIEAHAGRLWVTPNLSHGAIFQFTVPTCPGSAS